MRRLVAAAAILLLSACQERAVLTLGMTPEEPGARITQALVEQLEVEFAVATRVFGSKEELLDALTRREVHLAIVEQPEAPMPSLRMITPVFPSVLHVMVRKDRLDCSVPVDLETVVAEGSLFAGSPGTAGRRMLDALVAEGLLPDLEGRLLDSSFGSEPDAWVVFGGILSTDARSRLGDYCLASLDAPSALGQGAWVEGIAYRLPHLTPFTLPRGLYPELSTAPVVTLAVQSLLVGHEDVPEQVVYGVLQTFTDHLGELLTIYPLAGERAGMHSTGRERTGMEKAAISLALHPGAARFLNRDAPGLLERYAELLAFLVTALIAVTSAIVGLTRMRRQAKKDRLDQYFDRLTLIRQQLLAGDANREALARDVVALQSEVTGLVVEERVAADAALVAFLELSNQILRETAG